MSGTTEGRTMAWSVAGNVLIACNCDYGCPCNFNALPTHGACEGGWIWIIENGHVDGVRLDGIGVGLFAKWPGAIHHGGGRAICYVDERASAGQRAALSTMLRGELGGTWGIFIMTYELAETMTARIVGRLAGHATSDKR